MIVHTEYKYYHPLKVLVTFTYSTVYLELYAVSWTLLTLLTKEYYNTFLFCLFQTQGVKTQVNHPCYPQHFNISVKLGKDVFDSPCTKSYRPAQFNPRMSVSVVGTGDYQSCLDNVKKMFSFDNCSYSKCSFDGVFQPSLRGRFMVREPFTQRQQQAEGARVEEKPRIVFTHRPNILCSHSLAVSTSHLSSVLLSSVLLL